MWKVTKYGVFFWSVFSCIRTEYGNLLRKTPYSVRIQENTDQKKLRIWTLFTQWAACYWVAQIFGNQTFWLSSNYGYFFYWNELWWLQVKLNAKILGGTWLKSCVKFSILEIPAQHKRIALLLFWWKTFHLLYFAEFSEKLIFRTPWYAHKHVCVSGGKKC